MKAGAGSKEKELDEKMLKLTKENKELSVKLETYFEEMEEMESKNEEFEIQNKKLKHDYQQLKSIELVGSNMTEITTLENDKQELEAKLQRECEKRETAENELFKVEEEYENFKMEIEERETKLEAEIGKVNFDLFGRKSSLSNTFNDGVSNSQNTNGGESMVSDEGVRFLIRKKQKLLDNRDKEIDSLHKKVTDLEKVLYLIQNSNSRTRTPKLNVEPGIKLFELMRV